MISQLCQLDGNLSWKGSEKGETNFNLAATLSTLAFRLAAFSQSLTTYECFNDESVNKNVITLPSEMNCKAGNMALESV
jgi:hypothetical protein